MASVNVLADNPIHRNPVDNPGTGEPLADSMVRFLDSKGIRWSESGEFVERGKFKEKTISAGKFIESVQRFLIETNAYFAAVPEPDKFHDSDYLRIYRQLESDYSTEFANKIATKGSHPELYRELFGEYVREFPLPIEFGTGDIVLEVFQKYRPGSCMGVRFGYGSETWLKVYSENPESVGIIWTTGKHPLLTSAASALVWFGKSETMVDRLYSSSWSFAGMNSVFWESVRVKLESELGKPAVSIHDNTGGLPRRTGSGPIRFRLKFHGEPMPYCDTLAYCSEPDSDNEIVLSSSDSGNCSIECRDVDGTDIVNGGRCKCQNCGDRLYDDECYHTEHGDGPYCCDCYGELFSYSDYDNCEYPADDVLCVTLLDRTGRERETTISQDTLDSEFQPYSGELYDSVEYIHHRRAVELDSGEFVDENEVYSFDTEPNELGDSDYIVPFDSQLGYRKSELTYDGPSGRWLTVPVPVPYEYDSDNGEYERKIGEFLVIRWNPTSTSRFKVMLRHAGGVRTPIHTDRYGEFDCLRFASLVYPKIDEQLRGFILRWSGIHNEESAIAGPILKNIAYGIQGEFSAAGI
jgi:hypothetical protein